MDDTTKRIVEPVGSGPAKVCPFLGVQDDPETYFSWPIPGHLCYHVGPPQPIRTSHQEAYCLDEKYNACVVYAESGKEPSLSDLGEVFVPGWGVRVAWLKAKLGTRSELYPEAIHREAEAFPTVERGGLELDDQDLGYFEEETGGRGKVFWGVVALVVLVVLAGGAFGINRLLSARQGGSPVETLGVAQATQASSDALTSPTPLSGLIALTQTMAAQSTQDYEDRMATTATFQAASTSHAQETADQAAALARTPTPTPIPTQAPSSTPAPSATLSASACLEASAYQVQLVSGPDLSPPPGYKYVVGSSSLSPLASWVIQNASNCDWNDITLLSLANNRTIKPALRHNGELVTSSPAGGNPLLTPGDQIEILLGFNLDTARYIHSEWVLVINGITLNNLPHLAVDVNNWVVPVQPTPTASKNNRPPPATSGPPPGRPTDTPPPIRP